MFHEYKNLRLVVHLLSGDWYVEVVVKPSAVVGADGDLNPHDYGAWFLPLFYAAVNSSFFISVRSDLITI